MIRREFGFQFTTAKATALTLVLCAVPALAQIPHANTLTSFSNADGEHVYFLGADHDVHQLYWNGQHEYDQNLTLSAGGPPMSYGTLTSFNDAYGEHVYYVAVINTYMNLSGMARVNWI